MSPIYKFLLVLTSFAPLVGVIVINHIGYKTWWVVVPLFIMISLIWICWKTMKSVSTTGETFIIYIKEFERRDQGILTFMFIYILPLVRSSDSAFLSNWALTIIVFLIIAFVIVDVGAYNINPIMRACGYRVYEIKNRNGIKKLLITQKNLLEHNVEIQTRKISHDIYVEDGER